MKKLFILLACLFSVEISNGQIVFEHSYNTGLSSFYLTHLNISGYKYFSYDYTTNQITGYNLNHSIFKNISVPVSSPNAIWYLSEELFDTDSAIEYLAYYGGSFPLQATMYIFKEDGTQLFFRDSIDYLMGNSLTPDDLSAVVSTDSGTKLIVHRAGKTEIYSLPGHLTCSVCDGGIYNEGETVILGVNNFSNSKANLLNCYPNPTDHSTRIDYSLPQNVREGEIIFYGSNGGELKRFKVTSAFDHLIITTQDLQPGTYYYQLVTSSGISDGKKLVVIR